MNPVSFILAIIAIVVFLGGSRLNRPWADTGLGLALLVASWMCQLMWVTTSQLHIG